MMRLAGITFLAVWVALGQTASPIQTGPKVGSAIPEFTAKDQTGVQRSSTSILGPKGAILVFFRSADW